VTTGDDDAARLRSVALQNAHAILLARQRAEEELVRAKEALERKTRELAHSLAMMCATLEATTDGILVTDAQGNVTDFNEMYLTLWRLPREVLDSRLHSRVLDAISAGFRNPQAFQARVREIDASGEKTFDVLELADGRVFERFSSIQLVDGRNVGRVWSVRDITDQRRAEDAPGDETRVLETAAEEPKRLLDSERLARAEAERASAMKDEFLATLSHELRTPLNAILGWAKILRMPGVSPVDFQRGLEVVERNARMQAQLIEDLLDMSQITSGKISLETRAVALAAVIEAALETVRPLAQAKGVLLTSELDPVTLPVIGDPNRLQQVVWNLLSNAIKFTDKGGRVQVVLRRADSAFEIVVADTGVGIAPEFLPYVFDRQGDSSNTRTASGLGLGLAIVKHLVELHGGTVQADSSGRGAGTTFTIALPLIAAVEGDVIIERRRADRAPAVAAEFRRMDLTGVKVLVVDDNADARTLIQRMLEGCGASVTTAATVGDALSAVEHARPHVLVSDVAMPEADGYELLRRIRALGQSRGGGVPAIALTAFARSEDRTRALRAGFLHHIAKPLAPSELVATVASIVGRTGPPVRE
jgi:signal transduction histidine kinase/ActR/RegA family two-component response regulator